MINNEILIATDSEGQDGEKIITALSKNKLDYENKIQNTYNIITSLEGNWGTVEVQSDTVDINLTDGIDAETLSGIPYNLNDDFGLGMIEIVENASKFRHFGMFLDGEIGVFDSYWREDPNLDSWSGDGMSVLVKQNNDITISDFIGEYKFIDVDGDTGTININDLSGSSIELSINVPADGTFSDEIIISDITNNSGLCSFEADLPNFGGSWWSMMLVPDKDKKILILGTKDPDVLGAGNPDDVDGGIFIGIKQ